MDRLTIRYPGNSIDPVSVNCAACPNRPLVRCHRTDCVNAAAARLAAYEDVCFDRSGKEIISLENLQKLRRNMDDGQCD